jgi:ribonuclease BN (tRNA processing enzyme)
VFVTHHHSDHVSGYPALALHGWLGEGTSAGGFRRLDMWGPKPVVRMQKNLTEMFRPDIEARTGLGLKALPTLLHGHQYTLPRHGIRKIMEDRNVVVHATRVNHGTDVADSYGYRFDLKRSKKSITFSGDTAPTKNLIALAKDTDTLVHEAMYLPGLQVLLDAVDPSIREALRIHNLKTHTNVADIPSIAKQAGAKRLVFCHYAPGFYAIDPFLQTARQSAATIGYPGEIIAPDDLDSIPL